MTIFDDFSKIQEPYFGTLQFQQHKKGQIKKSLSRAANIWKIFFHFLKFKMAHSAVEYVLRYVPFLLEEIEDLEVLLENAWLS